MNKITIEIVPHSSQNYETCGDYGEYKNGDWWIKVSDMGNLNYAIAISLHELFEKGLLKAKGVKDEEINKFDIAFEKLRKQKPDIIGLQEPGDMISAPYYEEHQGATVVEKLYINKSGEDWKEYEKACDEL